MPKQGPHRRGFLGGLAATFAGLAGCQGQQPEAGEGSGGTVESGSDTTPSQVDGGQVPPHDHSGPSTGGGRLEPTGVAIEEFQQPATLVVYNRQGKTRALDASTGEERFAGDASHEVIQRAIDSIDGGTIYLAAGEYSYGPPGIQLRSNIRLVGAGRGATVLRLKDGVNGRRGQVSAPALHVGQNVENVTIANLEIDGNESGNRGVPPYPLSPHHHGIIIHGSEPQVPEDEKPANVTVRNVSVHDTVRSNVVLAGRNCELENLWLSNSASDHWLYMGGASQCRVSGVHASGFARTSGIVFGVGERRAFGTTLEDVTISNVAETPYQNDQGPGLAGRYPVRAITMRRSSANAYENTVRNLQIRIPGAIGGSSILVGEPHTRIESVTYRGPTAGQGIIHVDDAAEQTTIVDLDLEITDIGEERSAGIVHLHAPDVTVADSRLVGAGDETIAGVYLAEGPRPVARTVLRDLRIDTTGPVIRVNRGEYGVPQLLVDSVFDRQGSGTVGFDRINPIRKVIYEG